MNILSFGDLPQGNEETSFRVLLVLSLVDTITVSSITWVRLWESLQIHRRGF